MLLCKKIKIEVSQQDADVLKGSSPILVKWHSA